MINAFVSGAVTVQFNAPPNRESDLTLELHQVTGMDSAGQQYVYDKSTLTRDQYSLVFPGANGTTLASLLAFASDTIRGSKTPFTWWDHEGTSHTVWLIGAIRHLQTGADRYRIELTLEEDAPWNAPAATTVAAAMASKTAAPVWIFKLTINAVDYYLSDNTFTVGPWSVTTKPWIADWGRIQEGITNGLTEYRVSDFSVSCLVDPAATPNLETLALTYPLETSPCSLFLWYHGATDGPREMFRGYVQDVEQPDDKTLALTIEDESSRLQNYVGRRVTQQEFPSAAADDIGRVIPIVIGTVEKLRALAIEAGATTTLLYSLSAVATTIDVSDASALYNGCVIVIDDETILVGTVTGDQLTGCTRGYASSVAVTHSRGAIVWEALAEFVYVAADHPVDSIPRVIGIVGDAAMDITAITTRYTGQTGNVHSRFPGMAVVTLPTLITVQQAANLVLSDTIAIVDGIVVNDTKGVSDGVLVGDNISVNDTIAILSNYTVSETIGVSDGITISDAITVGDSIAATANAHNHTLSLPYVDSLLTDYQPSLISGGAYWCSGSPARLGSQGDGIYYRLSDIDYGTEGILQWKVGSNNYPSSPFSSEPYQYRFYLSVTGSVGKGAYAAIYIRGSLFTTVSLACSSSGPWYWKGDANPVYSGSWADIVAADTYIHVYFTNTSGGAYTGGALLLDAIMVRCYYAGLLSSSTPVITKSGGAYRAGAVDRGGSVSKTGGLSQSGGPYRTGAAAKGGAAYRSGAVTSTGAVTKSGTTTRSGGVTLSGNNLANTLVGDRVLVDVVKSYSGPGATVQSFLSTNCNITNFSQIGTFPGSYMLNGAITEYRRAIDWLNYFALQLRSWFRLELGVAKLIYRPDTITSIRTIAACRIAADGTRIHSRAKANLDDVINIVQILFDRDWDKDASDTAYRMVSPGTSPGSIANYGEREKPELFRFDFVTNPAMADDLCVFYVAVYAPRQWLHQFETFLDQADLQFGDGVTLGFAGGVVGQVLEVGLSPGSTGAMDSVKFTVAV